MKKLLALILCVMMFVAVIPTAAFADVNYPTAGAAYTTEGKFDTKAIKDAVTTANDAIKLMQGTVVANETVFGTIKTVDDLFVSMAKNIFADYVPYDENDASKSDMEGDVKKALRTFVGTVINGEMTKDTTVAYYTDATTHKVKPDKFLTKYISAFNKATNSAEAQKYIEAVLTTAMANAMIPAVEERMSDLKDSIADWEDGTAIWNSATGYGFADSTPDKLIDSFGSWNVPKTDNQILIGPQGIID